MHIKPMGEALRHLHLMPAPADDSGWCGGRSHRFPAKPVLKQRRNARSGSVEVSHVNTILLLYSRDFPSVNQKYEGLGLAFFFIICVKLRLHSPKVQM